MHDELGAGLTRLALLGGRTHKGNDNGNGHDQGFTGQVTATARELTASLGEIVWVTTPHHDTLDQLAAYLREYAARFLGDAGLEARLEFPETLPARPVRAERRRDLFLLLKEALNNVVKHARARSVAVRFAVDDGGTATLEITDDGRGFPSSQLSTSTSQPTNGHGLRNLHDRATAAGGGCVIESSPERGTSIRLRAPLRVR